MVRRTRSTTPTVSHTDATLKVMAFGQSSGPPASSKQVQELLELLERAGHVDFRDARGPLGFTQRQAGGKFTHDEAAAFIETLQAAEYARDQGESPDEAPSPAPVRRQTATDKILGDIPAARLAAELQRRGWVVMEP